METVEEWSKSFFKNNFFAVKEEQVISEHSWILEVIQNLQNQTKSNTDMEIYYKGSQKFIR